MSFIEKLFRTFVNVSWNALRSDAGLVLVMSSCRLPVIYWMNRIFVPSIYDIVPDSLTDFSLLAAAISENGVLFDHYLSEQVNNIHAWRMARGIRDTHHVNLFLSAVNTSPLYHNKEAIHSKRVLLSNILPVISGISRWYFPIEGVKLWETILFGNDWSARKTQYLHGILSVCQKSLWWEV